MSDQVADVVSLVSGTFCCVRFEQLYSTQQAYLPETTEYVELYDGAFLQMYGRGEGTVSWGSSEASIQWTNFPVRRPDGVYLPDFTGLIKFGDSDLSVMYRMHGISLLPDAENRRLFAGPVRWFTDHPELKWLNDLWGFEEGLLDRASLEFSTRAFVLHPEPPR